MKKAALHLIVFFTLCSLCGLSAAHDLDSLKQSYVLETKQIKVSEYPTAFNPSMIRWNESILFVFRIRDPITTKADQFGIMVLDEDFNQISPAQVLNIPRAAHFQNNWVQDPRLIECNNEIYLAFNDITTIPSGKNIRRMFYANLYWDGKEFFVENPEAILCYEHENESRQEKNWVPFIYNDQLLLAYSIFPHLALFPIRETNICETFSESPVKLKWDWGVIRGGSPALRVNNEYLAFFHTCKYMATKQSGGVPVHHYYMGAYTFESTPPFKVTGITQKPIVAKSFYTGEMYQTWEPLRVVFPGGFIFDERYIWVCYGRQDNEMWIVKFSKNGLLDSLTPP